ncbi:hypothetical protein Clacol_006010 [Clathrus columnatus]|uniref:Uncharacterized protein n=1 Tax=Clathrus columnatus TaxID=1419009 RepID=A0AAV5ADS1_9AGAM|nr:hypothetical protein Clacol_006010 [Clathrus columnatus]
MPAGQILLKIVRASDPPNQVLQSQVNKREKFRAYFPFELEEKKLGDVEMTPVGTGDRVGEQSVQ